MRRLLFRERSRHVERRGWLGVSSEEEGLREQHDLPEAATIEFEIMFLGMLFDCVQCCSASFLVVCFLCRVSRVRHLTMYFNLIDNCKRLLVD